MDLPLGSPNVGFQNTPPQRASGCFRLQLEHQKKLKGEEEAVRDGVAQPEAGDILERSIGSAAHSLKVLG